MFCSFLTLDERCFVWCALWLVYAGPPLSTNADCRHAVELYIYMIVFGYSESMHTARIFYLNAVTELSTHGTLTQYRRPNSRVAKLHHGWRAP